MGVKFITREQAAALITDDSTVVTTGFVECSNPEALESALGERFEKTGSPKNLTLFHAAGQGDGDYKAVNHFGKEGLLKRIIAGHYNKAPKIGKLIMENKIEAYNFPQGTLSQLFRDIAGKRVGTITHVGLQTFVDPRVEGGKLNTKTTEELVELISINGKERLFYKAFDLDFAFIKGSVCDEKGNVTMEDELVPTEVLSVAQAVHNCGGKVIVQVDSVLKNGTIDPKLVKVPRIYIDYIVVVEEKELKQPYYGCDYCPELTGKKMISERVEMNPIPLDAKKIIARRAAMEIREDAIVNLGIGVPELVSAVCTEEKINDYLTLTVEAGPIGGIPQGGAAFGGSLNAEAIVDQPYQFDFYDGGGLDIAFLGLAQVDESGNVNVSKFSGRVAGCGGFINITQNAKKVVYCGTFTAKGLKLAVDSGKLVIENEGQNKKFMKAVEQITFSGNYAKEKKQNVLYVTERAVFELREEGVTLIEVAPGIDLQKDILNFMDFKPIIAKDLKEMDARIFREETMGLKEK